MFGWGRDVQCPVRVSFKGLWFLGPVRGRKFCNGCSRRTMLPHPTPEAGHIVRVDCVYWLKYIHYLLEEKPRPTLLGIITAIMTTKVLLPGRALRRTRCGY